MDTKIFSILNKAQGLVSGGQIAKELGVSRTAVWKAINKLKSRGIEVESESKGYRLISNLDIANKLDILDYIADDELDYDIEVVDSVGSTNDVLRDDYRKYGEYNKVLVARRQTAGKGRQGKSFASPFDCGLYISFLLKPRYRIEKSTLVTTMAAVAVAEAITKVGGVESNIKWVNDIYIEGKKVAGILTETSLSLENGEPQYIILGVGINTNDSKKLPEELKNIATDLVTCGSKVKNLKSKLAAEIIKRVVRYYEDITNPHILDYYNDRLYLSGEDVEYKLAEAEPWKKATILGVDKDFKLILDLKDTQKKISYGEVIIRGLEQKSF